MFFDLVQNLLFSTVSSKKTSQQGGASTLDAGMSNMTLFFSMLLIFLIKVLLVMISYNIVVPKLMDKYRQDPAKFRPISFVESIFLVILFNNLFSRF